MNKFIIKLYNTKKGGEISPDDAQEINKALAVIDVKDVPEEQYENVKDYLVNALNANSVEQDLVSSLDKVLIEIEKLA